MRIWFVSGFLFLLVIIPFLIWGDWFSSLFSEVNAVQALKDHGQWAWLFGLILLIGDLFLPLPGTIIMSALGFIYGPFIGGVLASLGSFLSGLLAYILCRGLGLKAAVFLLGEKDLQKGQTLFKKNGGWIVAVSRWLPIFPEVISCLAGLNRMPAIKYVIALICGALPLGFIFAYIGYTGETSPYFAVGISAILPLLLWFFSGWCLKQLAVD